jgi:hypothetical protein
MGSRKKKQTTGYRYGLTIHMGICQGPVDDVSKIEVDDRIAWWGTGSYPDAPHHQSFWAGLAYAGSVINRGSPPQGGPISSSTQTSISAFSLFGGDKKEGGLDGVLNINMGQAGQSPDPVLVAALGNPQPAYRGILSLVYKGLVSANNPYLKAWATTVRRVKKGWHDDAPWYPALAGIGLDMNPAHIIYQCLTDPDWGMGYPAAAIDDADFRAAAGALYGESFGLSMMWSQQGTIESFVRIILDHIGGALRINARTGLYQLKLIRADYTIEQLPVFDPSNIAELMSFQRAGWGETINEVTVTYTDPDTRTDTAITIHNLANIQAQGGVVSQKINYSGICRHDIAQRVALRDLTSRSSPLSKAKFTVNRRAWSLLPGDVMVLNWPKLGLASVVLRVINVSTGTLDNGLITIDAAEDVFGLPLNSYLNQQNQGWVDPQAPPAPSPQRLLTELNYYDLATTVSQADLAYIAPDDGYPAMIARASSSAALDYTLLISVSGADSFAAVDTAAHALTTTLTSALAVEEYSTVVVASFDYLQLQQSKYAVIGSEYVRIDDFDIDTSTLTIARGVIDTVPQGHPASAVIYFADGNLATDPAAWPAGATVDAKVITRTGTGELSADLAPIDTVTIRARHNLPYVPAMFRINGTYLPTSVENAVTISWVHRNRLSQDSHLIAQDEASIAPESGQTYGIRIYDQNGVLSRTLTGITGESYTYPLDEELADCGGIQTHLRVELYSERDGLESWQAHSHRFERVYTGYGFSWGEHWDE